MHAPNGRMCREVFQHTRRIGTACVACIAHVAQARRTVGTESGSGERNRLDLNDRGFFGHVLLPLYNNFSSPTVCRGEPRAVSLQFSYSSTKDS